ncbi:uncharacterized protein EAE98_000579 [Botrytis deweyae]|uniref:NAD-dependent epimerase/dehydratase domain-containing protein n=1 Tax=Botrytis deweyae TaxID=2478750 RepID=A0ABQ7J347_9HELO|nr:uncharacterized protein EAE98_000579 [Botrytis deweyae]KAF7940452.1 hypothetical protein EAE98_000579 [Botrytis deweyae]
MAPTIVLISGAIRGLDGILTTVSLNRKRSPGPNTLANPITSSSPPIGTLRIQRRKLSQSCLLVLIPSLAPPPHPLTPISTPSHHQNRRFLSHLCANRHRHASLLGINHIDLVIANAGVSYAWPSVIDLKIEDLEGHFIPNVYGAVRLYQATLSLLLKSKDPKWVIIGSTAGMITNQLPIPNGAYGPSKAAIHWLTKRMNVESPPLNAFVLDPGWFQTELGNAGAV